MPTFPQRILSLIIVVILATQLLPAQSPAWQQVANLESSGVSAITVSPHGQLYAGTKGGAVFSSRDQGSSWTPLAPVDSIVSLWRGPYLFVSPSGDLFAIASGRLYRAANDGGTWIRLGASIPPLNSMSIYSFAWVDSTTLICGADNGSPFGGIFRSTDKGVTWSLVYEMNLRVTLILTSGDSGYVYAGLSPNPYSGSSVIYSTDQGKSWTAPGSGVYEMESVGSLVSVHRDLYCCGNSTILKYSDRGKAWSVVLSRTATTLVANEFGHIFAATASGVFRTTDEGLSWDTVATNGTIQALAIDSTGYLFAGSSTGAVFRSIYSTTGVYPANPSGPNLFALRQNYPNPFNPGTTISYSLPKTAVVSLRIFNMLGQEVSLLVNEQKSAGSYQVQWNASVPSGIYFYRLLAGEYVETKKMIVLK